MTEEFNKAINDDMEKGWGFMLMALGCIFALLCAIMCALDFCCLIDDNRRKTIAQRGSFGCGDDGVGFLSRFAAISTTCTWMLMLCALTTHNWVYTSDLGQPGCFCSDPLYTETETGCVSKATFGLWKYCIEPFHPQYGNASYPVCFDYKERVQTPGPNPELGIDGPLVNCSIGDLGVGPLDKTGSERFANWNLEAKRQGTGWMTIGTIGGLMVSGIFSEKAWIGMLLNLGAGGTGVFIMIIWISFYQDLAMDTGDLLILGTSGWMLVIAWFGAFLTGAMYGRDFICGHEKEFAVRQRGKKEFTIKGTGENESDYNSSTDKDSDTTTASELDAKGKKKKFRK